MAVLREHSRGCVRSGSPPRQSSGQPLRRPQPALGCLWDWQHSAWECGATAGCGRSRDGLKHDRWMQTNAVPQPVSGAAAAASRAAAPWWRRPSGHLGAARKQLAAALGVGSGSGSGSTPLCEAVAAPEMGCVPDGVASDAHALQPVSGAAAVVGGAASPGGAAGPATWGGPQCPRTRRRCCARCRTSEARACAAREQIGPSAPARCRCRAGSWRHRALEGCGRSRDGLKHLSAMQTTAVPQPVPGAAAAASRAAAPWWRLFGRLAAAVHCNPAPQPPLGPWAALS